MKKQFWTLRYTLINVAYFAAFCTIHAMAAVFLLDKGFTNTQVGILLAVSNILSAVCQPVVAGIIDKPGPLTNRRFILAAVTVIALGSVILMIAGHNRILVAIVYALIYMIQFTYMPVMTALNFEYQKAGCDINYGLARGLGSAGFAVTSAIIGGIVEKRGVGVLLIVNIAAMVISAIVVFTFRLKNDSVENEAEAESLADDKNQESGNADKEAPHNNPIDFAKVYPAFAIFLVATVCFYFAHNMINDFMIQIIRSLGGAEKELGYSNFLQAILELPVMACIGIVLKKISSDKMLVFSGVAFFIKSLILVFATNMTGMYVSQSFQLFAYAVFIPAAAYYVSSNMSEADQVKGQAFVTSAITVGGVFSNFISGYILDNFGIKTMLITGAAVAAVGVVIAFIAFSGKKAGRPTQL